MVIGFDAKRALANYTGLGNYSRYVINNLSTCCPEHSYRLYAPKDIHHPNLDVLRQQENVKFIFPQGFNKLTSSLWRTRNIISDLVRDEVQLFHGLSNEIPIGLKKAGICSIVTIHDVIFLRYPGYYKPIDRAIYLKKMRYACREADHIVTVSDSTRRDVIDYFGVNPQKISVIYQGCNDSFHNTAKTEKKNEVKTKYGLPEKFILNVGTIEARKNLLLAVKALLHVDADIHLVAVGKETAYTEQVKSFVVQNHLESRVHILTGVPLSDLPAIYQSAQLFVYPSFYEGFGIPVIEALYSDIPVIAAVGSCLLEAGGHHSVYVSPENEKALAEEITKILSNEALREKMIAAGKKYVFRFDDQFLSQQMIQLYQSMLK
ncbi:MAG: glycosyltransferase family 4 protein [Bacteroidales bacterium]|jgi:glycosyltransferase involved in cell wall biosynthesis|nr:glycosyltransferase family 4 protein [Bacteroidales bacterium]